MESILQNISGTYSACEDIICHLVTKEHDPMST